MIPVPFSFTSGAPVTSRVLDHLVSRVHSALERVDARRVTRFPVTFTLNNVLSADAAATRRLRFRPPVQFRLVGIVMEVRPAAGFTNGTAVELLMNGTAVLSVEDCQSEEESTAYASVRQTLNANTTYTFEVGAPPAGDTLSRVTVTLHLEHAAAANVLARPRVAAGDDFSRINTWWTSVTNAIAAIRSRRRHWAMVITHSKSAAQNPDDNDLALIHGISTELRVERHTVDIDSGTAIGILRHNNSVRNTGTCTAGTLLVEDPSPSLNVAITPASNGLRVGYDNLTGTQTRVVQVLFLSMES